MLATEVLEESSNFVLAFVKVTLEGAMLELVPLTGVLEDTTESTLVVALLISVVVKTGVLEKISELLLAVTKLVSVVVETDMLKAASELVFATKVLDDTSELIGMSEQPAGS